MSELSKKLREWQEALKANEGNPGGEDEVLRDCGEWVLDNLEAIISALETVEGIEELLQTAGPQHAVCINSNGAKVGIIFSDGKFSEGPTLHAAVMAAVEKARNG